MKQMSHNCETCNKRKELILRNPFEKDIKVWCCTSVPVPNWDEGRLTKNKDVWTIHFLDRNVFFSSRAVVDCINWKGQAKCDVRTDCYLSVMKKFQLKFPSAHFERITRADVNHILSPSWKLMKMRNDITFSDYEEQFLSELINSDAAQSELTRLARISLVKTVFLVCYESDDLLCHRSTVAKLIKERANKILEIQAKRASKAEVEA